MSQLTFNPTDNLPTVRQKLNGNFSELYQKCGVFTTDISGLQSSVVTINASLLNKVDKVAGYGLSKNDYSDADKALVNSISGKADIDNPTFTGTLTVEPGNQVDFSGCNVAIGSLSVVGSAQFSELTIGTGDTVSSFLSKTYSWNPGSIANGASETKSGLSFPGVVLGDVVTAAMVQINSASWVVQACVTATDVVEVRITNNTGATVDLAAGSLRVNCVKFP